MKQLQLNIEALIFSSEQSLSADDILQVIQSGTDEPITIEQIIEQLDLIEEKYKSEEFIFSLVKLNEGYQFLTKKEYYPVINLLQAQRSKKKLSQAALETLAIIAYRQPITKLEIEQIRGVNCDYSIQKLLEKELITIAGKSENIGKPLLYATSPLFMDYFGINNSAELPHLKDIATDDNEIGENKE